MSRAHTIRPTVHTNPSRKRSFLKTLFSNSFIIYHVKTKKITSLKEVGYPLSISVDFDDFALPFTLSFLFRLRRYPEDSRVFHRLSKQLEFRQKYFSASRIFNSLLGVWISRWNTVSRVWYIYFKPEEFENVSKRRLWVYRGAKNIFKTELLVKDDFTLVTWFSLIVFTSSVGELPALKRICHKLFAGNNTLSNSWSIEDKYSFYDSHVWTSNDVFETVFSSVTVFG